MESKSSVPVQSSSDESARRKNTPIVVGAVDLAAVVVAIAAWPRSKGAEDGEKRKGNAASRAAGEPGGTAASRKGGGVAARSYDEPTQARASGRINPAVRLPPVGMAPPSEPQKDEGPPTFANKAEEIAWYEKQLVLAQKRLEDRKTFYDRLPGTRERIEKGPDPVRALETFEGRKKVVEENYAKAQAEVAAIERKLSELKG
jgi:hypothetical protein